MFKRPKPEWQQPKNGNILSLLKVYNSLTNNKEFFKPREGKRIEWYSCGPTVYDVSHMGHARTYISIDILRRIMRDYLGYDIHYVMNITDIDDKIIKRARQNYLFGNYVSANNGDIKTDLREVWRHCENRVKDEKDDDMRELLERERASVARIIDKDATTTTMTTLADIKDAVSSWLDKTRGHTVSDNSIFEELPRHFERLFLADMHALNILPPDELTRVSEYIPQIVVFVATIIERGLAYESRGSVYFDTEEFNGRDGHYYAKLVPTAYGDASLLQDGEGVLSTTADASEKRSANDFALWKASKSGEPSWESPWGNGRPGWHIECSAMAGDKCGSHLDIHTGGVDLKFPHHDNELAQSEAFFGCKQWVNYFLHTGHLTIAGCKMSKSLKNFISIQDALVRHSSRQLRLAFLLSSWKDTLDYCDELMTAAIAYERMLLDFFFNVRHSSLTVSDSPMSEDDNLVQRLAEAKEAFNSAVCDSFNTRECLAVLKNLIDDANKLISSSTNIVAIADFVLQMMTMFGAADENTNGPSDGDSLDLVHYNEEQLRVTVASVLKEASLFREKLQRATNESNRAMIDEYYGEFCENMRRQCDLEVDESECLCVERRWLRVDVETMLRVVAEWRQAVRVSSRQNKWGALLTECDHLRDNSLTTIGVRLQDREGDHSAIGLYPVWAYVDKNKDKAASKDRDVGPSKTKLAVSVDPAVMFTVGPYDGVFGQYDDDGVPTHTVDGAELSKTKMGKLKKLRLEHDKKHRVWMANQRDSNNN